ncbi:integrase, partial [Thioclava sp. BHET1]
MKQLRKAPPYTNGFADRYGRVRWYFRRKGYPTAPLPGLPWSPEFMAAYEAAMSGQKIPDGIEKSGKGTISALAA